MNKIYLSITTETQVEQHVKIKEFLKLYKSDTSKEVVVFIEPSQKFAVNLFNDLFKKYNIQVEKGDKKVFVPTIPISIIQEKIKEGNHAFMNRNKKKRQAKTSWYDRKRKIKDRKENIFS